MPTYEYRRPDGSTFEAFQKISEDALTHDPETGVPVQRVISGGAGLQFKGDGFYHTDYVRKSGERSSAEKATKKAEAAETKASEPKAPAKKAEAAKPAKKD